MGLVKRVIEAADAEEAMNDWIRDNVDLGVEEGDEEWEEAKREYLSGAADITDWELEDYDLELERLTADDLAHASFCNQMADLEDEVSDTPSESM